MCGSAAALLCTCTISEQYEPCHWLACARTNGPAVKVYCTRDLPQLISVASLAGGTLYLFNRRVTRFFRYCQQPLALLTM